MPKKFQIFFSHHVETLYHMMADQLFRGGSHPFARRHVIVPSPAMKAWLHLTMAKDPSCGISAGLEVGYVDQTMRKLIAHIGATPLREPSRLELAVLIESTLSLAIEENHSLWEPVRKFVGNAPQAKKGQRRLATLALQLAGLFEKYGTYGAEALTSWEESPSGWQEELWRRVWKATPQFAPSQRLIDEALKGDTSLLLEAHTEIHLFSMSFLPPQYHRFLLKLSETIPIHYYVLSPCQAFWSDIKSDSECRRLFKFWRQRGASRDQLAALEQFLSDRNPLLANFGRLGREMAEQLEAGDSETAEAFSLPEGLMRIPCYAQAASEDLTLEEMQRPLGALDYVQADLTLLRNPLEGEKIGLPVGDKTIQVHVCPTKRREVENLYHVLMGIIHAHSLGGDPITPGDIIVMAPDLTDYESHIRMVFGGDASQLDFQLMEVDLLVRSPFVQAFVELQALASSRWDAASLVGFLELAPVKGKLHFTFEDVRKVREWVEKAGIRWGEDVSHCNDLLRQDHCQSPLVDNAHPGTWMGGINRLLEGLALTSGIDGDELEHNPLEAVDTNDGELLGKLLEFLKSLKNDLQPLRDGTLWTLEQWSAYLKALMDSYLAVGKGDKEESGHRLELIGELEKLEKAGAHIEGHRFAYPGIKIFLGQALQAKRLNYREGHLQAVRFCSLLPMRALPAKVIVLLGMEDTAFPRSDADNDMDLLRGHSGADYAPLQGDFDRSLFLEALLSARNYFILSYKGSRAGKEDTRSVLITEILSYLDAAYHVAGSKPSDKFVHSHPLHGFHSSYFNGESAFPSYSDREYEAARAFYRLERQPAHAFIPDFIRQPDSLRRTDDACHAVEVKALARMAKNPLQAYFNKTLGVYIHEKSKGSVESDEKFTLDALDLHGVKEKSLSDDVDGVFQQLLREEGLPPGIFKEVATRKLGESAGDIQKCLKAMGVAKEGIFDVVLAPYCESPMQTPEGWVCPPLHVTADNGVAFKVVGRLGNVTAQGLLSMKAKGVDKVQEIWPLILILNAVVQKHHLPIKVQAIMLKDGSLYTPTGVDLDGSLRTFLSYYWTALQEASPLIPQWVGPVLASDRGKLEKALKQNLKSPEKGFYNEYAKWAFEALPDPQGILDGWQKDAERVYGPLKESLAKPKGVKEDG